MKKLLWAGVAAIFLLFPAKSQAVEVTFSVETVAFLHWKVSVSCSASVEEIVLISRTINLNNTELYRRRMEMEQSLDQTLVNQIANIQAYWSRRR